MSACAGLCDVLLNNTSLTRQTCDFKARHELRKGGKRKRGRESDGGWRAGRRDKTKDTRQTMVRRSEQK